MKLIIPLIFVSFVTCTIIAVPQTVTVRNPLDCVNQFDPNLDYFPDKASAENSDFYAISYYPSFKIIRNILHSRTYVAYQCGTPKPGTDSRVLLPSDVPHDAKFFEIPLKFPIALVDTTVVTFFELLGLRRSVKYISGYSTSSCFKKLVEQGEVLLWDDSSQQLKEVNAVFGWGENEDNINEISAASLTGEVTPLGRTEWIEWISSFFNLEAVGNLRFFNMKGRYLCHKNALESMISKPKALWIQYSSWPTTQTPRFIISRNNYAYNYLKDAGADTMDYITQTVFLHNSTYSELPAFHAILKNADIIFDGGIQRNSLDEFISVYMLDQIENFQKEFKFLENKQVYTMDGLQFESGNDWFESALVESDVLLEDIIEVIYPSYQDHERVWVRNLAINEQIQSGNISLCLDVDKPLILKANCCHDNFCPMDLTIQVEAFDEPSMNSSVMQIVSWITVSIATMILIQ